MNAWARRALILIGALLLLPGACSVLFTPWGFLAAVSDLSELGKPPTLYFGFGLIWIAGLVAGAFGVWLLRRGLRG